jgi:hypothetical protein
MGTSSRLLLWLLPLVAACEIGDVHSSDPTVAGASLIASAIVSCFVAWLVFR